MLLASGAGSRVGTKSGILCVCVCVWGGGGGARRLADLLLELGRRGGGFVWRTDRFDAGTCCC